MKKFSILFLILLITSATFASNKSSVENKIETINKNIEIKKKSYMEIEKKYDKLLQEKTRVERAAASLRIKLRLSEKEMKKLDSKINRMMLDVSEINKKLEGQYNKLMKELVKYYKYSKISSYYAEGIWYERMNKSLTGYIEKSINNYIRKNKLLLVKIKQLKNYRRKKANLLNAIKHQKAELDRKNLKVAYLTHELEVEKNKYLAEINRLKQEKKKLEGLLKKIVEQEKLAAIKRKIRKFASLRFSNMKHKLKPPIRGFIVSTFGIKYDPRMHVYTRNDGVDIKGIKGECVHAVFPGKIAFIGNLPGYGNVIIVNHMNNYYTVYGGVKTHMKKGEFVRYFQCIGRLQSNVLHFEIRHLYHPVNPLTFLNRRYLR